MGEGERSNMTGAPMLEKQDEYRIALVYVTASLPYSNQEGFLPSEITALVNRRCRLLLTPRSPDLAFRAAPSLRALWPLTLAHPLFSWPIVRSALRMVWGEPLRAWNALRMVLPGRTLRIMLKNLIVYPKGLWLAEQVRRWGAAHIHAHWASTTATMAMVASEVSGIPWSFTAHRGDIAENNLLADKASHAAFARFISKSGLQMALERGVPPGKARLLHMGVEMPPVSKLDEQPELPRDFRILCPASLLPVKGHQYLLQALATLDSDTELWLAGDGRLRSELEALAAKLHLERRVHFLGHVAHDLLLQWYVNRQVDAVVLPSVDLGEGLHEGIPVALMEAMAHGVPVVSTWTGGIPELLEDGAGILVPPQDPVALGQAISRLKSDPSLRRALGQAGRRRVEEEFCVDKVVRQLVQWFTTPAQEGCSCVSVETP